MATPSRVDNQSPSLAAINLGEKDASGYSSPIPSIAQAEGVPPIAPMEKPLEAESSETSNEFKPPLRFYLTFATLAVITLAAALDATSKSTMMRQKRPLLSTIH